MSPAFFYKSAMDRFKLIPEVHLFLLKQDNILLLRRYQTGYEDGKYSIVAGHVDGKEAARDAMCREASEEAGIVIEPCDLLLAHLMHRRHHQERMSLFFRCERWKGKPRNLEPQRCDDLSWFPIRILPDNTVPYISQAISCFLGGVAYSEHGWNP